MTNEEKTAVCCLSSINLELWDEYKNNYQFFLDVMEMLDNVMQVFIDTAPSVISRAIKSAVEERSVGLGVMGFHSYLQKNSVPFDCAMAKAINKNIFSAFKKMLDKANAELGTLRGSPKLLEGTGLRFAHCSAIAPTASNALICGNVSPSTEPWRANAFRQDTLSGTFIQKNKHLENLILEKQKAGLCTAEDIWVKIVSAEGSIQDIGLFSDDEKTIYKTAAEIDQMWLVEHTADRQPDIDQGQSFNIFVRPDISIKKLHAIHFSAWKRGVKAMYYVRTEKLANTDKVGQRIERVRIEDDVNIKSLVEDTTCIACEG